jgi:hypothetical protein
MAVRAERLRLLRAGMRVPASRALGRLAAHASQRVTARRATRRAMRRALRHLSSRLLAPSWHTWTAALSRCSRSQLLLSSAISHMRHRVLSRGFIIWARGVTDAAVRNDSLRMRALSHMSHRELSRGWLRWRAMLLLRVTARRLLARGRAACNRYWRKWRLWHKACRFHADRQRATALRRWHAQQLAREKALADAFAAASALLPIQQSQLPSPEMMAPQPPIVIGHVVSEAHSTNGAQQMLRLSHAERIAEMAASAAQNAAAAARMVGMLAGQATEMHIMEEPRPSRAKNRAPARPRMTFHY